MDEWVWSNGGMILTGENWSTGRKTLYSVGGRWMNGVWSNGGMVFTGENFKYLHNNLSHCYFFHVQSHSNLPGIEPWLPLWEIKAYELSLAYIIFKYSVRTATELVSILQTEQLISL